MSTKNFGLQPPFRFFDGNSTNSIELYPRTDFTSSANKMFIVLISAAQFKFRGLKVSYNSSSYSSFYSCSALTSTNGNISYYQSRPDRNIPYIIGSSCWLISQPAEYVISLSFNHFRLNGGWTNRVRVFDGSRTNSPQLLSASGHKFPFTISSSSNKMLIVFSGHLYRHGHVRERFQATFNSVYNG